MYRVIQLLLVSSIAISQASQAFEFDESHMIEPLHVEDSQIVSPLHIEVEERQYIVVDPNKHKVRVVLDLVDQNEFPKQWYHHRVVVDGKIVSQFYTRFRPTKWLLVEVHKKIRAAMKGDDYVRIDTNYNYNEQRLGRDIILNIVKRIPKPKQYREVASESLNDSLQLDTYKNVRAAGE